MCLSPKGCIILNNKLELSDARLADASLDGGQAIANAIPDRKGAKTANKQERTAIVEKSSPQ